MTTTGRSTVVGVFEDRAAAERAIDELRRAGFNDDQIGYVVRDNRGTTDTVTGGQKTLAGEGAATGAISGGSGPRACDGSSAWSPTGSS